MPATATEPLTVPAVPAQQFPHWRFLTIDVSYQRHPVVNARVLAQRCRYNEDGSCDDAPVPPVELVAEDLFALAVERPKLGAAIQALTEAVEAYGKELGVL